jgi:hypothetical protein
MEGGTVAGGHVLTVTGDEKCRPMKKGQENIPVESWILRLKPRTSGAASSGEVR